MDAAFLLPLLAALVPVALFFALVRRRRTPARDVAPSATRASEPPADFGLDRETDSHAPAPAAEASSDTTGAAAAAAGGALILGYGASHRASSGESEAGPGHAGTQDSPDTNKG